MSFAHLHVHTEYSLLDGFSKIKKLVARAKEMGMNSVAITDHGTMFGVIEFYAAARDAGIKPVIGLETYVSARGMSDRDPQKDKHSYHLVLLAENETGYKNLLQIASAGQLEGFYYYPRVDHDFLRAHSQGLIATTSCMSGEVPRTILNKGVDAGRQMLEWYIETFGAENFLIELQDHNIPELPALNRQLVDFSKQYNLKTIATNDVHYINPSDERLQDIMLAIQTGSLLSDQNRMRMTGKTYYLRSPEEMGRLFAEVPQALTNTQEIADRCNVELLKKGYHLPLFQVPEGFTTETYLRKLCEEGLERKYGAKARNPEVQERLEHELKIIHDMGFDAYFLIVWDLCRYATEHGVWYNTRGSGAGSIVAYSLNITLIEPLKHGLLFERFLNPDRLEMPDIDLDFQDDRRGEILQYCAEHYGSDKVAQIITFGTLGARAAIRDVGRVMDIPLSEVDRISKTVPAIIPEETVTIPTALAKSPEFKAVYDEGGYVQDLIDTAAQMEGVARNAGTHAAGVVITDVPLLEYLPLHRPTSNSEESPIKSVTQFEMNIITKLGLLKVDFLGLATITVIHKACDLIRERQGIDLNLHNIPLDDPDTFEFISKGHTAGLFQLEGNGMTRYIVQMKPRNLSNIIAMVALFRPGPMEFIPQFIRRMHGEEAVTYEHPTMEKVFMETYGLPVYQEQLMMAVMEMAGYKASEADDLRKAISKKIKEKIEEHKGKFIIGAQQNGISEEKARRIFEGWENFARYGFNKSHAADYGVIAVETAYLKLHYSVEYMTALLSVTKNETAKVALYVADARAMGIAVLPPDVNTSCWDFTIEDRPEGGAAIRFGLGAVKNVGSSAVDLIFNERTKGPFRDLNDFMRRVNLQKVGRRSLEFMIKVGALDCFGQRTALLEVIDSLISISGSHFRAVESGQMSIFGSVAGVKEEIHLPVGTLLDKRQQLEWEKDLIGLYVSDHPITPYLPFIRQKATHYSRELPDLPKDQKVTVAGMITRIRTMPTKKGDQMAFATLEDIQGPIELVIFPRTWAKFGSLVQMESVLLVEGKPDSQSADPKILVDNIKPILLEAEGPGGNEPGTDPGMNDFGEPEGLMDPWQGDFDTNYYAQQAVGDPVVRFTTREEPQPVYSPPPNAVTEDPEFTRETLPQQEVVATPTVASQAVDVVTKPPVIMPPVTALKGKGLASAIHMVTVTLKASGERDRDVRRIKRVHGILNSFPGRDRYCFMIYEQGRRHLLDFPNDTTGVNNDLIDQLYALVGRENVQVENLTI